MSAINRFHEVADSALVMISDHLPPEAKLILTIYIPGKPEQDIVFKGPSVDTDEVVNTLRRRAGLSLDGDNSYKRGVCDVIVGSLAAGKQNNNPPPAGHWGQQFWDIGRAEGQQRDELVAALEHLVAVTTPDANGQIGAEEEHLASLKHAREMIRLHRG
ncbi:hypothetical protein JET76_01540 [Pseudomonas putida]|uniref:hypothetical protein n=1 Tax=Pseudomonas TaxID=286 RepID=UPI000DB53EFF|nr:MULTISPECIES: hypothetical protein [Pseudomonas]MBI6940017.1 hypothetical protein [Pseudomonas putida]MBI6956013.1 hypothetical protein [Pseudomonas putida]MBS6035899.1 hypothetical protein [Pseudomonas sp.]MCZ9639588.1 hypothetical protein [Pseudomonas putida]PZQ34889.1 MAG: hypothetical protein DI560_27055 [Pseudomonas putida]